MNCIAPGMETHAIGLIGSDGMSGPLPRAKGLQEGHIICYLEVPEASQVDEVLAGISHERWYLEVRNQLVDR